MHALRHHYTSLPSTNSKAFELGQNGAAHGEIVQADTQTAGRGRLGKSWQSPPGRGLYFSIIVRPHIDRTEYPKLTMTSGLAVAVALEKASGAEVQLKWPNDLYMDGRKAGGILCEAALGDKRPDKWFAVIGIGLNILTEYRDFPADLQETATSLLIATGNRYDVHVLLDLLSGEVLSYIQRHEQEGFAPLLKEWRSRDFLRGRWLDWLTYSGEVIHGLSEGPDDEGQLRVRDRHGRLHRVQSGDISLAGRKGE